jgi:predicted RNA-binding protein YlxR (DUF448 family)
MLADLDDTVQDQGPQHVAAATARLCISSREVKPIENMIRFVVGPDGCVVPDLKRKLPGRGVWVTARRAAVADAARGGAFQRGFKANVTVSKDLSALVEQLLERAVLNALAMAQKAGAVVAGFAKVEAAIETQQLSALFAAKDASADGRRKIAAALKRRSGDTAAHAEHIVTVTGFTSAQLDLALGRPNVVHAALLAQRPSETVLVRWRALESFRTADPDVVSGPGQLDTRTPNSGTE